MKSRPFNSSAVADCQTSFRLLVSDKPDILEHNEGNCWYTGRLCSTERSILYSGRDLDPARNYYLKIMTWNSNRMSSPFSQISSFSMKKAPEYNPLLDKGFENNGYG